MRGRPHVLITGSSAKSPRATPKPTPQPGITGPFHAPKNNHLTQRGFDLAHLLECWLLREIRVIGVQTHLAQMRPEVTDIITTVVPPMKEEREALGPWVGRPDVWRAESNHVRAPREAGGLFVLRGRSDGRGFGFGFGQRNGGCLRFLDFLWFGFGERLLPGGHHPGHAEGSEERAGGADEDR